MAASSQNVLQVENLLRELQQIQSVMRQRKIKPPAVSITNRKFMRWQNKYQGKFLEFVHDCIQFPEGKIPYLYQDETLSDLEYYKRVAQYGLHGFGKTTVSAWVCIGASLMYDNAKVITTASVWRQLHKYLWPEIHKWLPKVKWNYVGREPYVPKKELMTLSIKREPGTEAFAVASNQAAKIEGAHASGSAIVFIYDEAKIIPDAIWDSSEGAFSTEDTIAFALASSTPGGRIGRFYDICNRVKGYEDWHVNHITTEMAIQSGAVSQKWVDDRKRQWGENSAIYKNKVAGEFADDAGNNVIPLHYIEQALDRYEAGKVIGGKTVLGVDVARYGDDKSVIAVRTGNTITELIEFEKMDTMELVGWVINVANRTNPVSIVVDVIGVGAGVFDRLREQKYPVVAFNAAEHTDFTDNSGEMSFVNRRSASWWKLRELLGEDESDLAFPDVPELVGELSSPTYKPNSTGKILVESKEDIRKRLNRSTDYADSVIMAYMVDIPGMTEFYDTEVSLIQYGW